MNVKHVMTWPVFSTTPDANILQAVRLMLQHKISGLPVVDADGTLIGIVTEGDFLRRAETGTERHRPSWLEFLTGPGRLANEYVRTHARNISDVMTAKPVTVNEDTPLEEVVHLMEKHRIKRLPVVREGRLVGIISRANLLHALVSLAPTAPAPTAADESIHKNLLMELEQQKWAPVGFLNIVVRNGIVELWGTITDEREREALIVAARNTTGAKDVRDHLVWIEPMSGVAIGAKGELLAS